MFIKKKKGLNWIRNCVLTTAVNANKTIFKIADAKLYVPIVTLSAKDNAKWSKLLSDGFKRTVSWNEFKEYKVIGNKVVEIAANYEEKQLFDSSCQGVKILFVLASNNKEVNNKVSVDS